MQEQAISPYVIPGLLINETYIEVQVLKHFKVTPEELRGKDRHHDIVLARAITISLIKIVCKTRLLLLGQLYYKDHATVLHYFTMIAALYCTDKNTRELIEEIRTDCLISDEDFKGFLEYANGLKNRN